MSAETRQLDEVAGSGATSSRWPKLRVSEHKLILLVGDLVAVNVALLAGLEVPWQEIGIQSATVAWFLVITILWIVVAPAMECYDLRVASHRTRGVLAAQRAGLLVAGLYLLVPYVTAPLLRARVVMLAFVVCTLILLAGWRATYSTLLRHEQHRTRALIVGAGWAGETIVRAIKAHVDAAYEIVGFVDDDPSKRDRRIEGHPVLGDTRDLMALVRTSGVAEIVLAISRGVRPELHHALIEAFESGVRVTPMPRLFESVARRIAVEHVGDLWYAVLPEAGGILYGLLKRSVDILLGVAGTVGFLALLPFIAMAIRLDTSGPIFYPQERVGRGGKKFRLLKFRSMVEDAENAGELVWTAVDDPRISRVGGVLRRSHLDELPQFLNVLRGDMSVIGPRPERPGFVAMLQEQIPFYRTRLLVQPGLTGWAQVMYGYGNSLEDALTKLEYDLYYIKHQSLYLDISILLKTSWSMLRRQGV